MCNLEMRGEQNKFVNVNCRVYSTSIVALSLKPRNDVP